MNMKGRKVAALSGIRREQEQKLRGKIF